MVRVWSADPATFVIKNYHCLLPREKNKSSPQCVHELKLVRLHHPPYHEQHFAWLLKQTVLAKEARAQANQKRRTRIWGEGRGDHFCAAYLCNLSLGVWVRRGEENKKKEKIRRVWEDLRNRLPSISSPAPSLANHKWLDPRLQLALVWTSSPQLLTLSITKLTTAPSLFGRWTAITRHNQRGWPRI